MLDRASLTWQVRGRSAVGLAAAVILLSVSPTAAALPQAAPRGGGVPWPQDQVWIVSSRGLGGRSTEKVAERLQYWRNINGRWVASDLAEFLRQPKEMATSIFVTGNYFREYETIEAGWLLYRRMVEQRPGDRPLRFIIWSWPSDPVPGRRLRDAKIKFARMDAGSYHLASFLDQFDRSTPVSLSGGSFGAGIVVGSLELLAGGRLSGFRLPAGERLPHRARVVLIGGAFDNDWLIAGRKYGRALSQVEQMLVFVNPRDTPLRFYNRLYFRHSPARAIGRTGPAGLVCIDEAEKLYLFNSHPYVGHRHLPRHYFHSPTLVATMRPFLWVLDDLPPGAEIRTVHQATSRR